MLKKEEKENSLNTQCSETNYGRQAKLQTAYIYERDLK